MAGVVAAEYLAREAHEHQLVISSAGDLRGHRLDQEPGERH
ncbi:hypothetical protein [Micromonospora tulbaghiae]|nr:hypothetical protein [Micromonospora tulbaghiae]